MMVNSHESRRPNAAVAIRSTRDRRLRTRQLGLAGVLKAKKAEYSRLHGQLSAGQNTDVSGLRNPSVAF